MPVPMWRRQKINRAITAGIKEHEHATITGMSTGTRRNRLTDVECGKFERLVQWMSYLGSRFAPTQYPGPEGEAHGNYGVGYGEATDREH